MRSSQTCEEVGVHFFIECMNCSWEEYWNDEYEEWHLVDGSMSCEPTSEHSPDCYHGDPGGCSEPTCPA